MQRRHFLQLAILAVNAIPFRSLLGQEADASAVQLGTRQWAFLAELGCVYTSEDRVYCQTPFNKVGRGGGLVFPQFKLMQAKQALSKEERKDTKPAKYLAHDAEGQLIITTELTDAAKWVVTYDAELTSKMMKHQTHDDDKIRAYRIHHAIGLKQNKYLTLAAKRETEGREAQRIILGPDADQSFIWNNDYSGK